MARGQFRGYCAGFVSAILIVSTVGTAMAAYQKQATLNYGGISITLDGAAITPTDANGSAIEPFTIDGTTYLPVRGIANALGLGVTWDQGTQTVKLSSDPSGSDSGATSSFPNGWVKYDGSTEAIIDGLANGNVIYRDGSYWCTQAYADSLANPNVVYEYDVSGGGDKSYDFPLLTPDASLDAPVG